MTTTMLLRPTAPACGGSTARVSEASASSPLASTSGSWPPTPSATDPSQRALSSELRTVGRGLHGTSDVLGSRPLGRRADPRPAPVSPEDAGRRSDGRESSPFTSLSCSSAGGPGSGACLRWSWSQQPPQRKVDDEQSRQDEARALARVAARGRLNGRSVWIGAIAYLAYCPDGVQAARSSDDLSRGRGGRSPGTGRRSSPSGTWL